MSSPPRRPAGIAGTLLASIAFYLAAAGALALTRGANGVAALWPANGILLAALLIAPRRDTWRLVGGAALASLVANLGSGVGLVAAAGYTAANIGEALLAWQLAFGRGQALPSFVGLRQVARFFLATWVAAVASATLATPFDWSRPLETWSSWVTTDLLGLLIVTPAIVTAAAFVRDRQRVRAHLEAAALIAVVGAASAIAFWQDTLPMLFLPLAALLVATLRLGLFGAAASVAVIAVAGSGFTFADVGPLSAAGHGGAAPLVLFLQFYLLVLLATSLPLAALLAGRDRLVRQLGESNRLLRLSERSAGVGHWWISAGDGEGYCSPEVMRIHGYADGSTATMDHLLAHYHPDDKGQVGASLFAALRAGEPFDYEARIITPQGEVRRIRSVGTPDRASDGTLLGLFGTFHDVTRQVEGQHALEAARSAAEQAARLATAAAETDALTGVANRRKIGTLLDAAIAEAIEADSALSVALLDLDHFKAINDHYGHLVGDHVLTRVATVAAEALREADIVGRLGGEEFILLLPAADAEQAAAIAERVRLAIAADGGTGGPGGGAALPAVTASIGVATFVPGETVAALLHRADCALYDAKRSGRNMLRRAA